jgi:hypothetical protein
MQQLPISLALISIAIGVISVSYRLKDIHEDLKPCICKEVRDVDTADD